MTQSIGASNGTTPATTTLRLYQRIAELEQHSANQQQAIATLEAENARLTALLAVQPANPQPADLQQAIATLETERNDLLAILNRLPALVVLMAPDQTIYFANTYLREHFGDPTGQRAHKLLVGCKASCTTCTTHAIFATGNKPQVWEATLTDGRIYRMYDYPFIHSDGSLLVLEMGIDITERRQAEDEIYRLNAQLEARVAERTAQLETTVLRLQQEIGERQRAEHERSELAEQVITAQQDAIHRLSTPLIPLFDDLVLLPIIGDMDTIRTDQMIATLLEGVMHYRARVAILDITGMQAADRHTADAIIRAAQAARLLGTQVVLTGIGPQIAHSLAATGSDLNGIITRGTLQAGIAYYQHHAHN